MWLISLVAVVLCSYFLAKLTVNFVAVQLGGGTQAMVPPPTAETAADTTAQNRSLEDYKPVSERNFFDSKASPASAKVDDAGDAEAFDENQVPTGEAVATSLKVKLISTFVVGEGLDERSSCVVSDGGKTGPGVFTINGKEKFAPDIKITKVAHTRIEFVNKGRLEFLEIDDFASKGVDINKPPTREETIRETKDSSEEPKIEKKGEGNFVIDRAEIDAAIANLDKLYTQIRAVPNFKDGRPNGLKLLSVRSDSIFAKLGLKRGDVLQKINGMELDIKKGLEIFNQLKTENHIAIEVERSEKTQTLEYEIR